MTYVKMNRKMQKSMLERNYVPCGPTKDSTAPNGMSFHYVGKDGEKYKTEWAKNLISALRCQFPKTKTERNAAKRARKAQR